MALLRLGGGRAPLWPTCWLAGVGREVRLRRNPSQLPGWPGSTTAQPGPELSVSQPCFLHTSRMKNSQQPFPPSPLTCSSFQHQQGVPEAFMILRERGRTLTYRITVRFSSPPAQCLQGTGSSLGSASFPKLLTVYICRERSIRLWSHFIPLVLSPFCLWTFLIIKGLSVKAQVTSLLLQLNLLVHLLQVMRDLR